MNRNLTLSIVDLSKFKLSTPPWRIPQFPPQQPFSSALSMGRNVHPKKGIWKKERHPYSPSPFMVKKRKTPPTNLLHAPEKFPRQDGSKNELICFSKEALITSPTVSPDGLAGRRRVKAVCFFIAPHVKKREGGEENKRK